jgi:hypothetical protein
MTHQIGPSGEVAGYVDKRRGYKNDLEVHISAGPHPIFTANAGGTTTTIVGANAAPGAGTNVVRNGDSFRLFTAAGAVKEETVFTVTGQAVAGSTTVTFSPAAAVATASGDVMRLVGFSNEYSNAATDRRLVAAGFSALYVSKLTENDKNYQLRVTDDPDSIK